MPTNGASISSLLYEKAEGSVALMTLLRAMPFFKALHFDTAQNITLTLAGHVGDVFNHAVEILSSDFFILQ